MPRVVVPWLRWLRGLVVEELCVKDRCSCVDMLEGCGGRGVVCRGSLFLGRDGREFVCRGVVSRGSFFLCWDG